MSFRFKQKFHTYPCTGVGVFESVTLETGVIDTRLEDSCKKEMPDAELFDLETNLKAGTNLKEVGSKILGASQVSVDLIEEQINDDEINNNKKEEVNNEV